MAASKTTWTERSLSHTFNLKRLYESVLKLTDWLAVTDELI